MYHEGSKAGTGFISVIQRQCRSIQAERFEEAVQVGKAVGGCATVIAGEAQMQVQVLTTKYQDLAINLQYIGQDSYEMDEKRLDDVRKDESTSIKGPAAYR